MSPASACAVPPKASATATTIPIESPENQPALIMLRSHVVNANPARPSAAGLDVFEFIIENSPEGNDLLTRMGTHTSRHSHRLGELRETGGIFAVGCVLLDRFALCDGAQQPAHDLARTRLRHAVAETNLLRFRDRTDFLSDPRAQFVRHPLRFLALLSRAFQHDERDDGFADHFIGA